MADALFDAGEFRDWVTVLSATGQKRDELNRLVGEQRPLYSWFAKVQDATASDGSVAHAKPEVKTYTVKTPVHADYCPSTHSAIEWGKLVLQVVTWRYLGDDREVVQYTCSHTEGT